jgi:transcription antitermination factor NusG
MNSLAWFVAHTRPRREKKLKRFCDREGIEATLPCYRTVHKYQRKTVEFEKPLFPGYLFLQLEPGQKEKLYTSDDVAKVLVVDDQQLFAQQLEEILKALELRVGVFLVPEIGAGSRVRIKYGALRGLEGWVEQRHGMSVVLLRLDFIGMAAGIEVEADQLELI